MPAHDERRMLDPIFYGLSSAADHAMLWLAIGALRAARDGEPRVALRLGAILGTESAITNGLLKSVVGRIRPDRDSPDPRVPGPQDPLPYGMHRPITSSFPSGHATSAFTAAVVLADGRATAAVYLGLATLVAASRVYVRLHHTSDVVAGAALGLAFGAIARKVLPLANKG